MTVSAYSKVCMFIYQSFMTLRHTFEDILTDKRNPTLTFRGKIANADEQYSTDLYNIRGKSFSQSTFSIKSFSVTRNMSLMVIFQIIISYQRRLSIVSAYSKVFMFIYQSFNGIQTHLNINWPTKEIRHLHLEVM